MKRCRPLLGTFVEISVNGESAIGAAANAGVDGDAVIDSASNASAKAASVFANEFANEFADEPEIDAAMEAAFAAVSRVDRLMSFHRPDSELSRINAAEPQALLRLDAWTLELIDLAQELHAMTDGAFECGVGAELMAWGLLPRPLDARAQCRQAVTDSGSINDIERVDGDHVRLRRRVCIDLGGIAKGFAVDKAIEALASHGIARAVVNAGGDLRVLGNDAEPIHVRDPADAGQLWALGHLSDGAIATSSACFSGSMQAGGLWRNALIDPATRTCIAAGRSYSVIADRCVIADALTKALAVSGHLNQRCIQRYGAQAVVL